MSTTSAPVEEVSYGFYFGKQNCVNAGEGLLELHLIYYYRCELVTLIMFQLIVAPVEIL